MRERLYVPWDGEDAERVAMDIRMLAADVAPHVGMTPEAYEELVYRQMGWLYQMSEGRKAARG